jgi:hypothetical protein
MMTEPSPRTSRSVNITIEREGMSTEHLTDPPWRQRRRRRARIRAPSVESCWLTADGT